MNHIRAFFQKNKIYPIAAVVLLLLWVFFCFACWPFLLLPSVALMVPTCLCYIGARAGRSIGLAALILALAVGAFLAGAYGLLIALVLLLPSALFSLVSQDRAMPFWRSVQASVCVHFACILLAMLVLWHAMGGGDLVGNLVAAFESYLRTNPYGDQVLYYAHALGYASLPDDMPVAVKGLGMTILNPEAREQLILGLVFNLENSLRVQLPSQMVSGSILGGVACIALPRYFSRTRMEESDAAPLPSFSEWALPRQTGRAIAILVLGIGLMMLMSGEQVFVAPFSMLWAGVSQIMMLQGASTLSFLFRQGHMSRFGRMALVCAIWVFLGTLLLFLGCFDQFLDFRRIRLPNNRKEGEDDT